MHMAPSTGRVHAPEPSLPVRRAVLATYLSNATRRGPPRFEIASVLAWVLRRVGPVLLVVWLITAWLRAPLWCVLLVVLGPLLLLGIGAMYLWALRGIADLRADAQRILRPAEDADDATRRRALEEHDATFSPNEPCAAMARAEFLRLHDPEAALASLATIDVEQTSLVPRDEVEHLHLAIWLSLDQPARGRAIAETLLRRFEAGRTVRDGWLKERAQSIPLTKGQASTVEDAWLSSLAGDALGVALIAETFARTGDAWRARTLLALFDEHEHHPLFAAHRPALLRARAFVAAEMGDVAGARAALATLARDHSDLLVGFSDENADLAELAREVLREQAA
jgi:hypothetical protein